MTVYFHQWTINESVEHLSHDCILPPVNNQCLSAYNGFSATRQSNGVDGTRTCDVTSTMISLCSELLSMLKE